MMKKVLSLFIIYFALTTAAFAISEINSGDVLSLDRCIEIAMRNSPNIKKAKAQVRYQNANLGRTKAVWTPAIGGSFGWDGSTSRIHSNSSSDKYLTAGASISQMIYDFGKTNSSINIQKFNSIASNFELDYVILETSLAVKEAYFSVLAAKANQEVQLQNLEINERQYDQIKAYFDEGIRSRIDLINAEVNLSNAKIDLLSAQDKYCDAIIKLNSALYITDAPNYSIIPVEHFNPANDVVPVSLIHTHTDFHDHEKLNEEKEIALTGTVTESEIVSSHKLSIFDKTFEEVLQTAYENRPDLKSYNAIRSAMEESLKYAKRQWFPTISVSGGYNYSRNDGINRNSLSYGADVSIPMLHPLGVKYDIDAAGAQLDSANEDLNLIMQNIFYDVRLALCETKILENQIPLLLNRIKEAKENFELANGRYLEGIGNYIELQDARSKYLNSQQEYISTVYSYSLARANLDFVMGVK